MSEAEVRYDLPLSDPWEVVFDPFTGIEHRKGVNLSKCRCPGREIMCDNCSHFYARMFRDQDDDSWAPAVELTRKNQPLCTWGLAWEWHPLTAVRYAD
jgi:hypothetical protein